MTTPAPPDDRGWERGTIEPVSPSENSGKLRPHAEPPWSARTVVFGPRALRRLGTVLPPGARVWFLRKQQNQAIRVEPLTTTETEKREPDTCRATI